MAYTAAKQREYGKAYRGPYYQAHKASIIAYAKNYVKKYPEKHKLYMKRYVEKNHLAILMYQQFLTISGTR